MTPSLFPDSEPTAIPDAQLQRAGRMARRSDPDTSREAAAQHVASGANAAQRGACLKVLRESGDWMTSDEIAFHANLDRHAAARRMPELEGDRLVERGPARLSRVGKRRGVTWRVTPHQGT